MTCNNCNSGNIRTFKDNYLFKKGFIFLKKTEIQVLYVCGDCGTTKLLVHEYENNYQRSYFGRHTGHYEATHISVPNDYEKSRLFENDGFANYIHTGKSYFYSKQETKIEINPKRVVVEFSDWYKSFDRPPLYDPSGDYVMRIDGKDYPITIKREDWC